MRKVERMEIIDRCARSLANRTWGDIDFILGMFDLRTTDLWNDPSEHNYVREMLASRPYNDGALIELDDYLHGKPTHNPTEEPWEGALCHIFISHIAEQKSLAAQIAGSLNWLGYDGFVAHQDIHPGKEWIDVIKAALYSCHALIALLHNGFKESVWCDQEIGIAIGRNVPVIPIRFDIDPYGFMGSIQAINASTERDKVAPSIASEITRILLGDKRTALSSIEAILSKFENARSFNQANSLSKLLAESAVVLSADQLNRMRIAKETNGQVEQAFTVDENIKILERKLQKPQASI